MNSTLVARKQQMCPKINVPCPKRMSTGDINAAIVKDADWSDNNKKNR
jgi:hypothetical protein